MPKDAPVDVGAPPEPIVGPYRRVSEMQAKLHCWAAADPGRRFDDLFNFVCDPATLLVAFERVAGNHGANTPGVDGLTAAHVEEVVGLSGFLDDLRTCLKDGSFRPLPVRERKIPKPGGSGKLRKLGIPTIADRVVQAALKLVLEPIFEADFEPVSYGFRPKRRAQDAIAEIHLYGTQGYRWVLDADIEACFDSISHSAVLDRVRLRVKDKRVLGLVKAFLKAGVLTEFGDREDTHTGTPQGGIFTPPTQWATSVSMSRLGIEGWSDRGVSLMNRDMSGSTAMSCLMSVVPVVVSVAGSTRGGSTPLRSCWLPGCRRQRRRGCWPGGSAARCARHAGMPSGRPRAGRRWCRRRPRCSPSSCRLRWWIGCGRGHASRAARSPPW